MKTFFPGFSSTFQNEYTLLFKKKFENWDSVVYNIVNNGFFILIIPFSTCGSSSNHCFVFLSCSLLTLTCSVDRVAWTSECPFFIVLLTHLCPHGGTVSCTSLITKGLQRGSRHFPHWREIPMWFFSPGLGRAWFGSEASWFSDPWLFLSSSVVNSPFSTLNSPLQLVPQ